VILALLLPVLLGITVWLFLVAVYVTA
jgi:hypothetical protein